MPLEMVFLTPQDEYRLNPFNYSTVIGILQNFQARLKISSAPPTIPLFLWGNSEARDWNFQARLKVSSGIENFNRDWIFSIFGPLGWRDSRESIRTIRANRPIRANRKFEWFVRIAETRHKNRGFNCEWFARIDSRESRCESPVPLRMGISTFFILSSGRGQGDWRRTRMRTPPRWG